MNNFDNVTEENIITHNLFWSHIPDYPYRILVIGCSGSGKTNLLFNLINHYPDIHNIYLYVKDPFEVKHKLLIRKHKSVGLKHYNDFKTFNEYSNDMQDVFKNLEEYTIQEKNVKC